MLEQVSQKHGPAILSHWRFSLREHCIQISKHSCQAMHSFWELLRTAPWQNGPGKILVPTSKHTITKILLDWASSPNPHQWLFGPAISDIMSSNWSSIFSPWLSGYGTQTPTLTYGVCMFDLTHLIAIGRCIQHWSRLSARGTTGKYTYVLGDLDSLPNTVLVETSNIWSPRALISALFVESSKSYAFWDRARGDWW
jgi:hypothetical protein